ncbi:WD repeat-containing protein 89 [Smittium mucronatum]|uniref:WD repeat-containing protein 89 n=1 Tax=Smittium mucronatum TaxID=133383 RepID=A0A1R0H488_9FUNG|nr:WD repeat-containing protein 89 [Smittium mucronatum]
MNCINRIELPKLNGLTQYVQNVSDFGTQIVISTESIVQTYDYTSLEPIIQYDGYTQPISGMLTKNQNFVSTSSLDGKIRIYDVRTGSPNPVNELVSPYPLLSFDISCDNMFVVAGSEQVDVNKKSSPKVSFAGKPFDSDDDVGIFLWDTRMANKEYAVFTETHSNDVSQIKCHKQSNTKFMSGSTDGLVCIYDFETTLDENDAMIYSSNMEISVQQIGYVGNGSEFFYCITDMNTLSLWTNECTLVRDFKDLINEDPDKGPLIDYVVNCEFNGSDNNLYLTTGDISGNVDVFMVGIDNLSHLSRLSGGHSDIVRCIDYNFSRGTAISGGEDGLICLWSS